EELFTHLAESALGRLTLTWGEHEIDLRRPWTRLPFFQGLSQALGVTVTPETDASVVVRAAAARGMTLDADAPAWKLWKDVFEEKVEPTLVQPTFVINFPVALSPLAKKSRDNPALVDRFELFIGRRELANAYSELNDPIDQLGRFREQAALQARGDDEAHWLDTDYVRALEYGMPPAAGEGIGMGGVFLGVAALILVLAVMTGFQDGIRDKIISANPHLLIFTGGGGLADADTVAGRVRSISGVKSATPFVLQQALFTTEGGGS